MKMSNMIDVASIFVGFAGIITFLGSVLGGGDNLVFGVTKIDALLCSGILVLFAIWGQVGAIHHMILEKHGEIV